ncbi:MAG: response regulator transcription factor [Rikenellaceae bacterium]|nr:response regulator transcription factor [Rikenellaceae bacterium]
MTSKKVIIVDDHTLFRNGLKLLINNTSEFRVVGEAADGREFLDMLDNDGLPDVVLLDINMPEMDGIEAAEAALARYPGLPIITLSMYGEEDYYFKMVSLGVKGFVLKNSDIQEVVDAMESVATGGTYFSQELLVNLVSNLRSTGSSSIVSGGEILSEREREILFLICKGLSNQEIGEELFISKRTVDKHRANILAKTNCKNTANLVVFAIKNRLVEI